MSASCSSAAGLKVRRSLRGRHAGSLGDFCNIHIEMSGFQVDLNSHIALTKSIRQPERKIHDTI
jgi:hypothetical protein